MKRFISKERSASSVKGAGIQYLPGHDEKFVDYVINKYLSCSENILDLAGGGLRFAVPVALKGKEILVVDMDKRSLDLLDIVKRVNKLGKLFIDYNEVCKFISVIECDVFKYLRKTKENYDLISALRLVHFFSPKKLDTFFSLVSNRLYKNGLFVFSAMTTRDLLNKNKLNEYYLNSAKVFETNRLYRRFSNSFESLDIRSSQNLSRCVHFVNKQFIKSIARKYGFIIVESSLPSTRVVEGYILRKLG